MLHRHYKMQAMLSLTKWNQLARRLLQKHKQQDALAVNQRWAKMIKKLAGEGYLKLGYVAANSMNQMNTKLNAHHEKVRIMRIQGRWNTLIKKILKKAHENRDMHYNASFNLARLSRKLM